MVLIFNDGVLTRDNDDQSGDIFAAFVKFEFRLLGHGLTFKSKRGPMLITHDKDAPSVERLIAYYRTTRRQRIQGGPKK